MSIETFLVIAVVGAFITVIVWERYGVQAYPMYLAIAVVLLAVLATSQIALVNTVRIALFGFGY